MNDTTNSAVPTNVAPAATQGADAQPASEVVDHPADTQQPANTEPVPNAPQPETTEDGQ